MPSPARSTSSVSAVGRREPLWLAGVILLGAALRFVPGPGLTVEHFDEGVYTSNLWFTAEEGYRYPERHLYGPPLLPAAIEWSITFLGSTGYGPMLVSLLAGSLTPLLVWWLARRWFHPAAAIVAALLAATSEVHILYSRTALTDVLMGFWLLAAVAAIERAFSREHPRWILLGGLLTGLCWWTKYNGWLPLAIGLSGAIAWRFMAARADEKDLPSWKTLLGVGGLVIVVAGLVWAPAWYGLQDFGGYASVAANHSKYVVGLSGWFDSLTQQTANHSALTSWVTVTGLAAATALAAGERFTWNARSAPAAVSALVLAALALWLGTSPVLGLLAVIGLVSALRSKNRTHHQSLGTWMLTAWFVALFLTTPLYRAYPRLTLPWLIAAWTAAGAGLMFLVDRLFQAVEGPPRTRRGMAASGLVALVLIAAAFARPTPLGWPAWQSRNGLQQIALRLLDDLAQAARDDDRTAPPKVPFAAYVYGEPGLFHHLAAADVLCQPAGNLDMTHGDLTAEVPTFLITGPHAHRSPLFHEQLQQQPERFEPIAVYTYQPSLLVRLNEVGAQQQTSEIRLYRVLPE